MFQYLFEEAPTLSANLENKVKHVLSSPTVLKMVTWSYRLRFFIQYSLLRYIMLVHWLHFVALNSLLFLFCLKKKEDAQTLRLIKPVLNCQPVFSGQLTIQHMFP